MPVVIYTPFGEFDVLELVWSCGVGTLASLYECSVYGGFLWVYSLLIWNGMILSLDLLVFRCDIAGYLDVACHHSGCSDFEYRFD